MKLFIAFLFFLGSGFHGWSQINEGDTVSLSLNSRFSGNYQNGNVSLFILRSSVNFTFRALGSWVIKSQNSQQYQEFSGFKADNDIFSQNYIYFHPDRKIYPFGIAYISTNFRRRIMLRSFSGAGITYRPVSTEMHVLKLALNAVYERSRFDTEAFNEAIYNDREIIDLWRATLYLGGWSYLLQKKIRFSYDAYYQPAFNDKENYRTKLDFRLDCPVYKGFYFTSEYQYTHENVVPLGTLEDDSILTFGFGYSLKRS